MADGEMKFTSAIAQAKEGQASFAKLVNECCDQISTALLGQKPDLLIAFISPHFINYYDDLPEAIRAKLPAKTLIGCSAGGLIGNWQEVEQMPAIALTAAILPGVDIKAFHFENEQLPDLDDPQVNWEKLVDTKPNQDPAFVLLPDPFSFRIDVLVQGLDYAFPQATKIGGLASGANEPGDNALYLNGKTYRSGMVGVALSGNIVVKTVVAQGCRPIGKPMRVTRCHQNLLYEIDGNPAVIALHDVLEKLPPQDQELAHNSLFVGLVMDEFKDLHKPGDFLIRNILGIEPNSGALVIGELLRTERTLQFQLRDAATSADDLRAVLKRYRDEHPEKACGALLFSCLGRGQYLYGQPNHDSDCFREYLGEIPLGGFFCNGEIGPVGGKTFLHGYTSSFGIFHSKDNHNT
jgi:small ligand-binding sensory domain FIST